MDTNRVRSSVRIAGLYLGFGVTWIVASDWILSRLGLDASDLFLAQLLKGWGFVLASAALLFWLLRRERQKWVESQTELEEARGLLEAIISGTTDGIFVKDVDGEILFANEAAARMLGGETPDDVVGRRDEEIFTAESLEMIREVDRRVITSGEPVRVDEPISTNGGSGRIYEVSVAPLHFDGQEGRNAVVGVARDVTRERKARRALRESNRLLDAVVKGTSDAVFAKDRESRYLLCNEAGASLMGKEVRDVIGRTDRELFPPDTAREIVADDQRVMETGLELSRTERIELADGEELLLDTRKAPLREGGDIIGVIGISRDITEREATKEALERTEAKYRTLFHATPLGISLSELESSRFLEVNEGFESLLGYGRDELIGRRALELGIWASREDRRRLEDRARSGGGTPAVEARLHRKDGTSIWAEISAEVLEVDDEERLLAVVRDVTERRRFERELERMALYDGLTGLANRTLFRDRLRHALTSRTGDAVYVAVLFLDLDRFKIVNDTLGHSTGDQLLEMVASRLEECFREEDTVARLGGDEFGILLEEIADPEELDLAARRLVQQFEPPFDLAGQQVHVSASVGIAVEKDRDLGPDDLLRFSDIAMYRAKEEQGSAYRVFDPAVDSEAGLRLHRETELRAAIESEQFVLHYQPVVRLADLQVVGAEVLTRWRHPEKGLLSPGEFIPVAEETGLIVPLGRWIARTALRETRGWRRPGNPDASIHVGFNISARQLEEPDFTEWLLEEIRSAEMDPSRIILELTESVAIRSADSIHALRSHGIKVAVDDLGTGYASLEYLTHLEADIMKVDRLFISGIGEDVRDEAIVEAVAYIARRLENDIVAEGIETDGQLARLRELGYPYGQGFLFSRPVPAGEFEALLEQEG